MSMRLYLQSAIALLLLSGLGTYYGPDIFLYFKLAEERGAINIIDYSGDSNCTATSWHDSIEEWCYAYINFTVYEDIFWYPVNYDPYGRNQSFNFSPQVKDYKFQRSWGKGWRTIPLDRGCTGTWCGGKFGLKFNKFSIAFREGKDYQVRIAAIKKDSKDIIKWGFGSVDPIWYGEEIGVTPIESCITKQRSIMIPKTCKRESVYINNKTGINISSLEDYNCPYMEMESYEECIIILGYIIGNKKIICPDNYRCYINNNKLCIQECSGSDCNFDVEHSLSDKWDLKCVEYSKIEAGDLRISNYKKKTVRINEV